MSRHFMRKHYRVIQEITRDYVTQAPIEAQEYLLPFTRKLCQAFKDEYPEFDEERFLKLCALID